MIPKMITVWVLITTAEIVHGTNKTGSILNNGPLASLRA
jgi:hypothetical protein